MKKLVPGEHNSPVPKKVKGHTTGRLPAPANTKMHTHSSQATQRRAKAVHGIEELLGVYDNKVAAAEVITDSGCVDYEPIASLVATEMALARVQVDDAQRQVNTSPTKAAQEQRIADSKKACYFEAHAHALEMALSL